MHSSRKLCYKLMSEEAREQHLRSCTKAEGEALAAGDDARLACCLWQEGFRTGNIHWLHTEFAEVHSQWRKAACRNPCQPWLQEGQTTLQVGARQRRVPGMSTLWHLAHAAATARAAQGAASREWVLTFVTACAATLTTAAWSCTSVWRRVQISANVGLRGRSTQSTYCM